MGFMKMNWRSQIAETNIIMIITFQERTQRNNRKYLKTNADVGVNLKIEICNFLSLHKCVAKSLS